MSYLLDLVQSFNEKEMIVFKNLDLIGKEEIIRDEYAVSAHKKNYNEQSLASKHQLSPLHFDKILSILLDKTIAKFFGNNYELALETLLKKGLSQLALHELKIIERKQLRSNSDMLSFYKIAFLILSKMYFPNFNKKLTTNFGKKYLQALGKNASIDDIIYVELATHTAGFIAENFAGNEEKYRTAAYSLFPKIEKKLIKHSSNFAWFYYYFSLAFYYKFYGNSVVPFIEMLQTAYLYLEKCDESIIRQYEFRVLCELGFGYIEANESSTAFDMYQKAFHTQNDLSSIGFYQKHCFMSVSLIENKLDQAGYIFDTMLLPFLNKGVNKSLQFDIQLIAILYYLYKNEFDIAFDYLTQIRANKKKEITHIAQFITRVAENLYFYRIGDYKYATTIAKRNIKYIYRTENNNEQLAYYKKLFNCIYQLSKAKADKKPIDQSLQKMINELQGGMYKIYNNLL